MMTEFLRVIIWNPGAVVAETEQNRLNRARRALELMFAVPGRDGNPEFAADSLPALLASLMAAAGEERTADYANHLYRRFGDGSLESRLSAQLFDVFIANRILPAELEKEERSPNCRFLLEAARDLWIGISAAVARAAAARGRIFPAALDFLAALPVLKGRKEFQLRQLAAMILAADRFRQARMFRYFRGEFREVVFDSVKPVGRFFGFPSVRLQFKDHFHKFALGESNLPLLVYSLPGYGKTSMVLSYAYAEPELVIILPDPVTLERGWDELIAPLAARPDHRFVLFFDDIDPRETDWFSFRTNVGGALSLPQNIMPVLSANYEFPANILSRGRRISFPVFDELRCCEMVEDFLATFGVRHHHRNLISQIAADYTEEFGQKKFTELSPRSLIRYLSAYEHDQNKRRTIIELASGPMVTRPDAQLFYEFNIDLMRSLYGEEYIKRLLKQRLDDLSHG